MTTTFNFENVLTDMFVLIDTIFKIPCAFTLMMAYVTAKHVCQ